MVAPLHERIIRMPYRLLSMRASFRHYYLAKSWGAGEESASGPASSLERTAAVRRELPRLLRGIGARTMLDIPCGDFHWMSQVDLPLEKYVGADLVREVVTHNCTVHERAGIEFRVLDVTSDPLPRVDVVLCRDCLVHLSLRRVSRALANIKASGSTWLLATTFPGGVVANRDILTGGWRMLDLRLAPFGLPEPVQEIDEEWAEWPWKRLGLWRVADIPAAGAGTPHLGRREMAR